MVLTKGEQKIIMEFFSVTTFKGEGIDQLYKFKMAVENAQIEEPTLETEKQV